MIESYVAPSFEELKALAKIQGVELFDLTVESDGNVSAEMLCRVRTGRHHGIVCRIFEAYDGWLHDYTYARIDNEDACRKLVGRAVKEAKRLKCDVVRMTSVLPDVGAVGLTRKAEMKVFDSANEKDGWSALYNRRSVRRFLSAAKKRAVYQVCVRTGDISLDELMVLKTLHQRRWHFEGSTSAFDDNPHRVEEYANAVSNKHLLTIKLGDDILACHYGMIYGNTLLWHTPIINPKYMSLSPLRLLLAETARFCEGYGLKRIDFGLGDESYKDGYCNASRETIEFSKALTIKGVISETIGKIAKNGGSVLVGRLLDCARYVRNKICHLNERWIYYIAQKDERIPRSDLYVEIDEWSKFVDFMWKRNLDVKKWQYERFISDKSVRFVALADERNVYCQGWVSRDNRKLLERRQDIEGEILFDFLTLEAHRGKGYYQCLLRSLISAYGGVIYVNRKNIVSMRAIENVGFVRV